MTGQHYVNLGAHIGAAADSAEAAADRPAGPGHKAGVHIVGKEPEPGEEAGEAAVGIAALAGPAGPVGPVGPVVDIGDMPAGYTGIYPSAGLVAHRLHCSHPFCRTACG